MSPVNIGQAAKRSGLSAKMIRHYEQIGLLPAAMRSDSGYRLYGPEALETLAFIKRARDLGFSLDAVGALLALKRDPGRASADVQTVARRHINELDERIGSLIALRDSLRALADQCQGNAAPQCAILDRLTTPAG
ncbi:Cu(I)-responsive transcriptional regulator [Pseudomonas japonica]|uniref:Cu(I)-responsive transcriptional regulator n=1 Tax=Pseudomonas japonica TaxID=256466 RepID=UPI0015E2F1A8|nr:Cu(I)-responsive transcriptional regulator [Pseudomonas japonica]MBA1245612.1 Cu(I)-responsive transcriptional regulator [Pseudomonas japonica]MBA1289796.1 Cu(I)-responsive transcriptional regulator [Pseudomonas japonica]